MGLHFGAAQPPKSGSRSLQGTLEHSGPLARTAGALVLAPSIHRGVLPCVLSAADGATHVARAAAVFRARNVWGGYFFDMEEVMDTHIAKRNFKLYGEAHPNARLTRAQVVEIREEAKVPGTSRAWLAARFGVSRTTVDNIVRGVTWREAL